MNLLHPIQALAIEHNTDFDSLLKLYVLEGIARRSAQLTQAEEVILRGSLLTRAWTKPHFRQVRDLDFMAIYPFDEKRATDFVHSLCLVNLDDEIQIFPDQMKTEVIWEETVSPGVRYLFPVKIADIYLEIQIDMSFNDPLVPPAIWWEYPGLLNIPTKIHTIRPELALAWKVHGLFEFWDLKAGQWKAKDLYDIYLIWKYQKLADALFEQALFTAFEDRKMPLTLYNRVLNNEFGQSKGSHKGWKKFLKNTPHPPETENHLQILSQLRTYLDPFFLKGIAEGR
ncbi:MAG: nucleotidyl transferase AbiEii/AbiGii toxin family protein [Bacteroidia bacterium]